MNSVAVLLVCVGSLGSKPRNPDKKCSIVCPETVPLIKTPCDGAHFEMVVLPVGFKGSMTQIIRRKYRREREWGHVGLYRLMIVSRTVTVTESSVTTLLVVVVVPV